jgi:hypothetical protein
MEEYAKQETNLTQMASRPANKRSYIPEDRTIQEIFASTWNRTQISRPSRPKLSYYTLWG